MNELKGIEIGPIIIADTVLTTWLIMIIFTLVAFILSRTMSPVPLRGQAMIEQIIAVIDETIRAVLPNHSRMVLPFIATLWLFLAIANLIGLIPGLHSPTRDLSITSSLAILVFLSVHWFGIRSQGINSYLAQYLKPNPFLLPFHIMSEISRTLALAVRLFGNIMSLEMAALLILFVVGFLAPIPILMLHIIEALVQAYIFGMLALIYIAGGIQTQELMQTRKEH